MAPCGGKRGIRTPGTFQYFGFQDRRNRPLCHLSSKAGAKVLLFFEMTKFCSTFLQLWHLFLNLEGEGTD